MRKKLLALGNVLMEDDGVAIYLAEQLQYEIQQMGIEVVLGETDIGYLLSKITQEDYLIILDATTCLPCGEICCLLISEEHFSPEYILQHDISLLSLCKIYYPAITGSMIGIGVASLTYQAWSDLATWPPLAVRLT
jgi:hydrogenase maturation protease